MRRIDQRLLDEIVRRLVIALEPEEIDLYGSHAYGHPREDSDVDILVIVHDSSLPPYMRAREAYRALRGLFVPVEVKVISRSEFERRTHWLSSIERVVREKGRVLYESRVG